MENYHPKQYDTPDGLPVDIAIFTITTKESSSTRKSLPTKELKILLIKRKTFDEKNESYPFQGYWALPGGFSKRNETIDEAAKRELKEEANVGENVHLEQLKTVYYPGRDPRGWMPTVVYYALVKEEFLKILEGNDDAEEAKLFSIDEIDDIPLAFDHKELIKEAYLKVKEKMIQTTIAKEFLPKEFTISELFQIIQTVVPEFRAEKPNFIQKVVGSKNRKGLLIECLDDKGEHKVSDKYSNRPARLYSFNPDYHPILSLYNNVRKTPTPLG